MGQMRADGLLERKNNIMSVDHSLGKLIPVGRGKD